MYLPCWHDHTVVFRLVTICAGCLLPTLQVLSYHVIPSAAVLSTQLEDGQTVPTALADAAPLNVSISDGEVTFEGVGSDATVTTPDITAGASVIHVIDDVLLPMSDESGGSVAGTQGNAMGGGATAGGAAGADTAARSSASAAAAGLLTVVFGAAAAFLA